MTWSPAHPRLAATGPINRARAALGAAVAQIAAEYDLSAAERMTVVLDAMQMAASEILARDLEERPNG